MASSSQNNLSIGDNENIENALSIINNRTDDKNMNIRIPIEHCMQSDPVNSSVTNEDEDKIRNTKLDNNGGISGGKIANFDIGSMSRQELLFQGPQQSLSKNDKIMSYRPRMSAVQIDQADKLGEYNKKMPSYCNLSNDTLLKDKTRISEDQPSPYSIPKYEHSAEGNKRQSTDGNITNTRQIGVEQMNINESPIHHCCDMKTFYETHSSSKLQENFRQKCCDNKQNSRCSTCHDRELNDFVVCPNRVAQNHPNSEYSNLNHLIGNSNYRRDVSTSHLGTCPTHRIPLSEHSDCSFTGPPGIFYTPPSNSQHNNVDDYRHLCVSSIDPVVEKCFQCEVTQNEKQSDNEPESNKNPDLTVNTVNTGHYDSECGPSAIPCNINYSNNGNTQPQTLPNPILSQNSSTDTEGNVDEIHVMNYLDL